MKILVLTFLSVALLPGMVGIVWLMFFASESQHHHDKNKDDCDP